MREGDAKERSTDIELPRKGSESGLTVDTGENVEGELLWTLHDDVFAGGVPPDHVVVLWPLEEPVDASGGARGRGGGRLTRRVL